MVKISVIISYYKNLTNLKLILKALHKQSETDFEAIISEDDYNKETVQFLEASQKNYRFKILHVNQKNKDGFRKNSMLNKSIKISNAKTLVFIDGDCIPHKHFIKAYLKNIEDNVMLKGRRVMLGEKISTTIIQSNSLNSLNGISILFSNSSKKKESLYLGNKSLLLTMKNKGLLGCNWGIQKEHLIAVNGFDEDYIRAAVGEDTDIEWRLQKKGIGSKSMKNKAIVYHLHHEKSYANAEVEKNRVLLKEKIKANNFICLNGLEKL